jgi:hypothetical protein
MTVVQHTATHARRDTTIPLSSPDMKVLDRTRRRRHLRRLSSDTPCECVPNHQNQHH